MTATIRLAWTNDCQEPEVDNSRDYDSYSEALTAFARVCRYADTLTATLIAEDGLVAHLLKSYRRPE